MKQLITINQPIARRNRALDLALALGCSFAALTQNAAGQAVPVTQSIAPAYPGTTVTNPPSNNPPLFIETSNGTTTGGLPGLTPAQNTQYQALQGQLTTITTAQQGLQDEWEANYLPTCGADNYPGTDAATICAFFLPSSTPAEITYRNRALQILSDFNSYNQQAKTVRNDMRPLLSNVSTSGAGFRCNDEMTDVIFGLDVAGAAIELSGFILEAATSPGSWVGAEVASNVLASVGQGLNVAGIAMTGIQNQLPNCEGVFTGTVQTYANFQSKMGLSAFNGAITLGYDETPTNPFDENNPTQYYYSGITMGGGGLAGAGFGGAQAFTGDVTAIAIGNGAQATSVNSTALGNSASATAVGATAFGANTLADAQNATAAGINAQARGVASTAMGAFSQATGVNSSAFGNDARATGASSTASGDGSRATNTNTSAYGRIAQAIGANASAFGNDAQATGDSSTASGDGSRATNTNTSAFGRIATANAVSASAFGNDARATGASSTASGDASRAGNTNTSAYGHAASASGVNASAFGNGTTASGQSSAAGGDGALANNTFASAFGHIAQATGVNSSAYGNNAAAGAQSSTAVGDSSTASATNASAFGNLSLASAGNAVAGGNLAWANGVNSSAYGNQSFAAGASSVAVGDSARAQAANSVAVGHDSLAAGPSAIAVGNGAQAINSVAVGAFAFAANGGAAYGDGARAFGINATALGPNSVASHNSSVAIGENSFTTNPNTVSFGSAGNERRLMNVAMGVLGTDAVNLDQLNRAVTGLNRGIAATTALATPMLALERGETGFATGAGYFEGETGMAFRVAHQMDMETPILLSAGYSTAGGQTGAAQVGLAFKF